MLKEIIEYLEQLENERYVIVDVDKEDLYKAIKAALETSGIKHEIEEDSERTDYNGNICYVHAIYLN